MISFEEILQKIILVYKRLQFGTTKQQAFLEDFAAIIDDGVPPNKAIEMLCRIYNGILKEVALDISKNISTGKPLAEGMRAWFQVNVIELVRVGEESGALAQTIQSASESLKQKKGAFASILASLLYPLVVIIMGCIVVVYIKNSVFSDFAQIKPVDTWPGVGQNLLLLGNIIQHWFWLVILLIIIAIVAFKYVTKNYTGEFRSTLDIIPLFSLYKKIVAANLMETLGLLISNGVVFKAALKIIQYNASPYIISHVLRMESLLGSGKDNIAEVLDTGLIKKDDILRLRVIAEAKGFEHALIRLGKHSSEEGLKTIRRTAKITGVVLLAIGGLMIVFMVLAIYSVGMFLGSGT